MILIDPLWDALKDEFDYETYFGKEVWGERKIGNEKLERSWNNLINIIYSDFYNILSISLYNHLIRNISKLLIETDLPWENEA